MFKVNSNTSSAILLGFCNKKIVLKFKCEFYNLRTVKGFEACQRDSRLGGSNTSVPMSNNNEAVFLTECLSSKKGPVKHATNISCVQVKR